METVGGKLLLVQGAGQVAVQGIAVKVVLKDDHIMLQVLRMDGWSRHLQVPSRGPCRAGSRSRGHGRSAALPGVNTRCVRGCAAGIPQPTSCSSAEMRESLQVKAFSILMQNETKK